MATEKKTRSTLNLVGRFLLRVGIPLVMLPVLVVVLSRLHVRAYMDAVRALNKRVLNPVMMRTVAGNTGTLRRFAKGRRTGKEYATPVMAEPTQDGFIIPLPYGEGVDWLKNVRAAGRATIEAKGGATRLWSRRLSAPRRLPRCFRPGCGAHGACSA